MKLSERGIINVRASGSKPHFDHSLAYSSVATPKTASQGSRDPSQQMHNNHETSSRRCLVG